MTAARRGLGCVVAVLTLAACTSGSGGAGRTTTPSPTSASPGSPSSPAPSASGGPSRSDGPRTATILGSGDVLLHPPLWAQAHRDAEAAGSSGYDFRPMYASIAPDVRSADLATCELETPLAPPGGPFEGYPDFAVPPQVLTALKGVGYDSCTTASNHTLDQGYAGVKRTLRELDAAGLRHTGSASSAAGAARPLIDRLPNGVRIGELAYAFGFNGNTVPAGEPWLTNLIDVPAILAAAHRLKRDGADIVVVSMHWGIEYDTRATSLQRSQARALLASPDVDLILGDHAHVVQPAQRIHGKWVFFGMGNQVSRHDDPVPVSRRGIMPRVTFTQVSAHRFRATAAAAIPTLMQDSPDLRLIDLHRALAAGVTLRPGTRRAYDAARAAIVTDLGRYGAFRDGLTVP